MSKSTKRIVIISLVFALLSVGAFTVMVFTVVAQGESLTKQITALAEQTAQESSYHRLVRQAEETAEERTKLQEYFLEQEGESIDFLYYIESVIAPQVGVTLETNKLELLNKEPDEAWLSVSFSFSGTREAVQRFVQVLETVPYVQRLVELQMEQQSSMLWQATVTIEVRVLAYENQ